MKKCTQCNEIKPLSDFYLDTRGTPVAECKLCCNARGKLKRHSLKGHLAKIYYRQKSRGKHNTLCIPQYTKQEFIAQYINDNTYLTLHAKWVKSNYNMALSPSADRLNDYKGYSFDNIQWLTWKKNNMKAHLDTLAGTNTKRNKAIKQFDKKGKYIATYFSIAQAHRETNINRANIIRALKNFEKSAGGFKWQYVITKDKLC